MTVILMVSIFFSHIELFISLRSRRKRERGRGARTREKNGVLGARDEGTPVTKTPIFRVSVKPGTLPEHPGTPPEHPGTTPEHPWNIP